MLETPSTSSHQPSNNLNDNGSGESFELDAKGRDSRGNGSARDGVQSKGHDSGIGSTACGGAQTARSENSGTGKNRREIYGPKGWNLRAFQTRTPSENGGTGNSCDKRDDLEPGEPYHSFFGGDMILGP